MHYRYKTEEWAKVPTKKTPSDKVPSEDLAQFIEERDREGWELFSVHLENTTGSHYRLVFRKPAPELDLLAELAGAPTKEVAKKEAADALLKDLLALNGSVEKIKIREVDLADQRCCLSFTVMGKEMEHRRYKRHFSFTESLHAMSDN
jgi:hypothetical protein